MSALSAVRLPIHPAAAVLPSQFAEIRHGRDAARDHQHRSERTSGRALLSLTGKESERRDGELAERVAGLDFATTSSSFDVKFCVVIELIIVNEHFLFTISDI